MTTDPADPAPNSSGHGGLTEAQRAAVEHVEGPLLVLAGPGSGKTRVITHRIVHLLEQGVRGQQIVALTFTNKAADEMRSRVARLVPRADVWIGTFHRFCARLLRQHASLVGLSENFSIYDDGESRQTLKLAADALALDLTYVPLDKLVGGVSWAKRELIRPEDYVPQAGNPVGGLVARLYPLYQQRLLTANAVDFDDLLLHVGLLLRENPDLRRGLDERFRFILVDEYQDTNLAQYAIVRGLSIDHPNLAVTGDPDQCIYGWRGANLGNILDFERDYPQVKVVRLEQNYRSTPNILSVAERLIEHNVRRKAKRLWTEREAGAAVRLAIYASARQEADDIARQIAGQLEHGRRPRDFALFYRTNALSRLLEEALLARGIPYQVVSGQEFYQRREIKDILAYLHLLNNPCHDAAFRRIVNVPARGIGKTTVDRLNRYAQDHGLPLLETARRAGLVKDLSKRAAVAVARFVTLYDQMSEHTRGGVGELVEKVSELSGYVTQLELSDSAEDQDRLANIQELITAASEFDASHPDPVGGGDEGGLEAFLEQSSLVADTDNWEHADDKVSLMTLHAAKGLEFPVVFLTGLEEGLLPHERSRESEAQCEEERRLLFVGITRAQDELQLSLARRRARHGDPRPTVPSQFLSELPLKELETIEHEPEPGTMWRGAGTIGDRLARRQATDDWGDDEHVDPPAWEEPQLPIADDTSDDLNEASPRRTSKTYQRREFPLVRTAAEMLRDDLPRTGVSAQRFEVGMLVVHPDYGPGRITGLAGEDKRQSASVQFFGPAGRKVFRLAFSPLQPLSSTS
ncbi:MAG: UvrD-helicase domain-containing protein [Pirellulaceae bacterium]|nr:UvrD-helicase domain-containing protein [Pirellulaceae bacterium]